LGSSRNGQLETRLFPGFASNQATIYVQIYDNDKAFAVFEIQNPITILADRNNFTNTLSKLISRDPLFETNRILNEGSYLPSLQEIQTISSLINDQSLADKFGLISSLKNTSLFPQTFGPLLKYSVIRIVRLFRLVLRFAEKIFNFRIFKNNNNITKYEYELNRNERAKARDFLISFVNAISISDMDTVRTQAGMLSMLTSQIDEISRMSEVIILLIKTVNIYFMPQGHKART
jgi:hypothetical protein